MHVVVTGASSGIGRALALVYGRAGASLTLIARRTELLAEVEREIGRPCHLVARDLSQLHQVAGWISDAEAANGPIDVLVNNAGVMDIGYTAELPMEVGQRMLDVCLSAPLRLTRAVLPTMLARRAGTVVQVASVASFIPPPGGTWYGAAKAGLSAFSETLRTELRGTGVNVLTVYPGPVATALADGAYASYGESRIIDAMPKGTAQVLAARVYSAVERRSARLFYPRPYGMTRWFPRLFQWLTAVFTPEIKSSGAAAKPVATPVESHVSAVAR